ncbi:NACHT domain-containing protein [Actinomadura decatromicini]|uniref:NACHT domain-containing protein n=1 Tax=Actinomadura decatromicini TaxID=2604572 RepID=A0A5D3F815_9ACTN|nr:NACHT domain-containing protein [Actinomadura decatromicini]TYK44054.1 NACHT domain-containing protein [Actinomadura decatromicini]
MIVTLADVVSSVLTEAIVGGAARLAIAVGRVSRRGRAENTEVRTILDSAADVLAPRVRDWPPDIQAQLAEAMDSPHVLAYVHELFALRFTGVPRAEIDRLGRSFRDLFPGELDPYAYEIFICLDDQIFAAVESLRATMPVEYRDRRQDAQLVLITATLNAISRHIASISTISDDGADRRFLDAYRRQVLDHHGRLEPPDFERRRRIPIDDILVAPGIVSVPDDPEHAERLELAAFAQRIDRSVLLGDPGAGKTTACHALMHMHAIEPRTRVPFLVTLREFAVEDPPARSVVEHIEHILRTFYQCPPPAGLVERLLLSGMAMVIFDGLDELLDTGRRGDVASIVERFSVEYPLASILVTSRVIGYDEARLDDRQFDCHRIAGFGEQDVRDYVAKWFAQERMTAAERERDVHDFLASSASVADLRTNPLMLALMCILYRGEGWIPQNRPEIYEQCASLLFRRWDIRRRIRTELRAHTMVEPTLHHLAYWLFTERSAQPYVTEHELTARTAGFLLTRGFEQRDDALAAADELVRFLRGRAWVFNDVGTSPRGESWYAFTHRTFLEYFAAARLAGLHDSPADLGAEIRPYVVRQEWDTVAQLAVQIKDRTSDRGAERLFRALLAGEQTEEERENLLGFLGRCLTFAQPPAEIVRSLAREAAHYAFRPNEAGSPRLRALGWIMYGGTFYTDLIAEEIDAVLTIHLADAETQELALLIGISLDDLPWLYQPELRGGPDHWNEAAEAFSLKHADSLMALAPGNLTLAVEAFRIRRLDITHIVRHHGMTALLRSTPHVKHHDGSGYSYYRNQPLSTILLGDPTAFVPVDTSPDSDLTWIVRQLDLLGRHLPDLPAPPWADRSASDLDMSINRYCPGLPHSTLDLPNTPHVALALAVVLFMSAEVDHDPDGLTALVEATPHLAPYAPYLRQRFGYEPPPPHPASLLERWAAHQVDFTAPDSVG